MNIIFITGYSLIAPLIHWKKLENVDTKVIGFSRSHGEFEGTFHSCDFTKPQVAASIFDSAFEFEDLKSASSITFICNAGILGPLQRIENLEVVDIQENITGNLIGSAIALSHFLKYTSEIDTKKLFIQISSGAALPERAKPSWALYCASKTGQEQLVRSVASEQSQAKFPAKVINLDPGLMETSMQELIRSTPKSTFPDVDRFIEMKEKGEVSNPSKVADGISRFLENFDSLESGERYTFDHFGI